jgi:hypothetical protein
MGRRDVRRPYRRRWTKCLKGHGCPSWCISSASGFTSKPDGNASARMDWGRGSLARSSAFLPSGKHNYTVRFGLHGKRATGAFFGAAQTSCSRPLLAAALAVSRFQRRSNQGRFLGFAGIGLSRSVPARVGGSSLRRWNVAESPGATDPPTPEGWNSRGSGPAVGRFVYLRGRGIGGQTPDLIKVIWD